MAVNKELNLNWIDDLKARADICSVISSYVSLEKKGQRYWACCPFHAERTPSFAVDAIRGTWYCYGACHEGGDVISFEEKINNIDFREAVERLANRVGLKLPESFNFEKKEKITDREYALMTETARFYRENLQKNKTALEYLKSRHLSANTIASFGLGYSPDYNELVNVLHQKGYERKEMYDLGLLGEHDGRFYDFLAERIIVPIFDPFGKVIAFGGRILKKPENGKAIAKYKNTRETKLFEKNKVLYGLNFVRKARIGNPIRDIIIVEGYMDVIGLHQAGVKNAVASMGTSLTDNQARLIKNMVDTVYICYDGDFAGQTSTLRGLKVLKAHDLNVKVMTMPDGKDPDELVVDGPEPFLKLKEEALDLYDYLLFRAQDGLTLSKPADKITYINRAIEIISELSAVDREVYLNEISKKTDVPVSKLRSNLKVTDNKNEQRKAVFVEPNQVQNSEIDMVGIKSGRFILNTLVVDDKLLDDRLDSRIFESETQKKCFEYIVDCIASGRKPIASTYYEIDGVDKKEVSEILATKVDIPNFKAYYNDCIGNLLAKYYKKRKAEIRKLIGMSNIDEQEKDRLKKELQSILKFEKITKA